MVGESGVSLGCVLRRPLPRGIVRDSDLLRGPFGFDLRDLVRRVVEAYLSPRSYLWCYDAYDSRVMLLGANPYIRVRVSLHRDRSSAHYITESTGYLVDDSSADFMDKLPSKRHSWGVPRRCMVCPNGVEGESRVEGERDSRDSSYRR